MKEIYELDVYKLSEQLSDLIWYGRSKLRMCKNHHGIDKVFKYQVSNIKFQVSIMPLSEAQNERY